jgi:YVTN family beta-propeller protein
MVATQSHPNSVTLDPSATHLYATNLNFDAPLTTPGTISQYAIGPDGSLTPIPGPLPTTGAQPSSLAINPLGTFAYVANYNNGGTGSVSQYNIVNGALVPMLNPTVNAGNGPNYIIVDPTGRYVYVANLGSNDISEYTIDQTTGALTPLTIQTVASPTRPSFIAINATGTYAYVTDSGSDQVSQYTIMNGVLTLTATVSTGAGSEPFGLTIDATGKYLYVADRANTVDDPGTPAVSQFLINPANGSLTPLPAVTPLPAPAPTNAVAAGLQPTSIATTP